jgi:hypothetical protein
VSKVSQETLAAMTGTNPAARGTLNQQVRKLGFIEYTGGLTIRSSLLSVVLHD